jgi:Cu/Ag efflux protein CusF
VKHHLTTFAILACALSAPALAQAAKTDGQAAPGATATAGTAAADMADGEVRKVDKNAGKVTLKHGEIKALDMPPMTMVFAVKDKAMLERVQVGDKVRFKAVNQDGRYTVTEMQVVR